MDIPKVLMILAGCGLLLVFMAQSIHAGELYVKPGVAPGGSGTSIDDPVPTIQEAIDGFEGSIGYVFLHPGIYEEDVEIRKGRFWFRPVERTGGALIQGSLTIRSSGCIVRGLDFHAEGTAIILADGAANTQILQTRILHFGEGSAGIDISGSGLSGIFLSDNVVDMREVGGAGRTAIRVHPAPGTGGIRLEYNQIAGCETGIEFTVEEGHPEESGILLGNRILENDTGLVAAAPCLGVISNEFRGNTGAAIRIANGSAMLEGNTFNGDMVGVWHTGGEALLTNNVIAFPRAQAVLSEAGTATVTHNTLHAETDTGAALVEVRAGAEMALRHTIISGPGALLIGAGEISAFCNLYSRETAVDDEAAVFGSPGFTAPRSNDFRLRPGSPAAHAAKAVEVTRDAAGIGRPWGETASIGAYEAAGERAGRIIHVAAGAPNGDGSKAAPFGDIAQALEHVYPGDTVLVGPGEYAPERIVVTRSGAPGAPVTLRSEILHEAKIRDTEVFLEHCSHVRLEGFDFSGTGVRQFINAGSLMRHCEIVNNVFTRTEGHGRAILITGPAARHNLVEGNRIAMHSTSECRGSGCCEGIQIVCQRQNRHQVIRGNHITGCYYGIQTGGGSYPTAPPGYNLIEDNLFYANRVDGIHTKSTDDLIRNNIFFRNGSAGISTREGARNVIIGNWILENSSGLRLHSPSHFIINNIIAGNRAAGIRAFAVRLPHYEPAMELWIAHNTIAGNGSRQIILGPRSGGHILRNIIVGGEGTQPAIDRESTDGGTIRQADANLYFNTRPPLLREYEGGLYDRIGDPLFLDVKRWDFRLADDSPAHTVPSVGDALRAVLSAAPAGIPLPEHIGANLGPPWAELPED